MATGLGSFVKGALEGYQTSKENERKEALMERENQRFAMEQERHTFEKDRMAREQKEREAQDQIKLEALAILEEQRTGTGRFAEFANPDAVAALKQTQQPVEQKDASSSYQGSGTQRLGVRPATEAQTASATPKEESIFKQGGEGLYKDQQAVDNLKYKLIGETMKKSLLAKGDFGAAMLVDRDVNRMIEEGYDLQRKKAAAYVTAGAPPATVVGSLKKVYGFIDDGKTIDETKSTYDPKTRSYTLAIVDQKTGAVENRSFDQQSMLTSLRQLDPVKVFELNMNSDIRKEELARQASNRAEDVSLKKEELGIQKMRAGSDAALNRLRGDLLKEQVRGADVKAKAETIDKSFPLAGKVFKPEDLLGKSEAEKNTLRNQVVAETKSRDYAIGLASLNPSVDPRVIIGAAKSASTTFPTMKQDTKTGRNYFDYGSSKIFID